MKKVRNIRWHTVLIDTLKTETSNFVLASVPPSNPFPPLFHIIYCKCLGLFRLGVSIHNNKPEYFEL